MRLFQPPPPPPTLLSRHPSLVKVMLVELEMIGQRSGQLLVDPEKPTQAEKTAGVKRFGV